MRQTVTKIKGITVNIEVLEVHQQDAAGCTIWYHAAIYIQRHGSAEKTLVRKSRLPGAAENLRQEIQKKGIQAFDRIGA